MKDDVMLFAQMNEPPSMPGAPTWMYVAAILVVTLLAAGVIFTLLVMWHMRGRRQLLHTERMRSIEMGHPLQETEGTDLQAKYIHNVFWIAFWMAIGVPVAAFWSAALSTNATGGHFALGVVIWIAASLASIAAVICTTVLMVTIRSRTERDIPAQKFLPRPSISS
jgi:hypothetical protein